MKRKLVQQGSSTLMISLPSKWIKMNKLGKGSEIDLEEKGKDIVISSNENIANNKAIVDVSNYDLLINRVLISLYLKGYEEIELVFKDRGEMKKLKNHVLEELLGFEIIKQSQNKLIIRDLTGFEKQNVDDIIKRIFFIIDGMLEDLINSSKKEELEEVARLDSSINKLVHFSLRILNVKGYNIPEKTTQFYGLIFIFEEIGDLIKQLIKNMGKERIMPGQLEIIKKIRSSLNIFERITFNFNKEEAVKFAKSYEEIKNSIKQKNRIDLTLQQINEAIIRMNDYLFVSVL